MNALSCRRSLLVPASLLGLFLLSAAEAQVEHKREWAPAQTLRMVAPTPPRLAERQQAFAERSSPETLEGLAHQLFGLMDPAHIPEHPEQQALYRAAWAAYQAGDFPAALETYKAFSFHRLRNPPQGVKVDARDPARRTFIEFYNQPDELMQGVFRLQMFDAPMPQSVIDKGTDSIINYYRAGKHNAHMTDIILQNGQPGAMNWVYRPPNLHSGTWHIPDDEAFAAAGYRCDMAFTPLLAAYLESRDPAYLQQWAGYVDDLLINFRRDLAEAGLVLKVDAAGAGGPALFHVAHLVLNAPEADALFPAGTFARLILQRWIEDLPLIVLGARATGANRAMHMYGALLTEARVMFPELRYASTLLTERRRILESYARQYMMPDGTSIDYAPNYNKNFINWPVFDIRQYRGMAQPPAWFNEAWAAQMREEQFIMARYLVRHHAPDGTVPGYKDPLRPLMVSVVGTNNSFFVKTLPEAIAEPNNAAVIQNLYHNPGAPDPGFASDAFPYGGYYFMRESWDRSARFLFFHDFRPGENGSWRHHKNLFIQAFGQRMLTAFRWESPLLVDGAGHINSAITDLYPEDYAGPKPWFGTHGFKSAWQEPQPNRWHSSARFDLAEGGLRIPFAEKFPDGRSVFIDDVQHHRQILFLREAGCWIVTDRIQSGQPRDYHLLWGFDADRINPPEWETDWRNRNRKPPEPNTNAYSRAQIVLDPATQSVRTAHPARPNLSIHHAASLPLALRPGHILQNNDVMFGNSFRAGPEFSGDRAVVASLLYPRDAGSDDLRAFTPLALPDGAGFDALTPEGGSVAFRALPASGPLEAGEVRAEASALLVHTASGGRVSGVALDATRLAIAGKEATLPATDVEFAVDAAGRVAFEPIYRPMARVAIHPEATVFTGTLDVVLTHPEAVVEIRYTLDGSEPTLESALYTGPIRLADSTRVRAKAYRRGLAREIPTLASTQASLDMSAWYRKADLWPAQATGALAPGLAFAYYEDDWTLSMLKLPIVPPKTKGVAATWFDLSARQPGENSYAFVYEGYLEIPASGVYTFHGPFEFFDVGERAGYDLKLEVDRQEWYPSTKAHSYGNWSVPLAAGPHAIRVSYIDVRPSTAQITRPVTFTGDKPALLLSGPGLDPQPVPAAWLRHQNQ